MDFLVLVLLIGQSLGFGTATARLALYKGYDGYFWSGFFFGPFALLYVIGLPIRYNYKYEYFQEHNINEKPRAKGSQLI